MQAKTCKNLPIQCIGLTLYDDDDVMGAHVTRTQWISPDCDLSGQAVLLVDEVDDSRKTLAFAAEEMLRWGGHWAPFIFAGPEKLRLGPP